MSSIYKPPFGYDRDKITQRQPKSNDITFRLHVEGEQIPELLDFLELVYDTRIQVRERAGSIISFKCDRDRTAAGIRVALRLHKVEVLSFHEW